MVDSPVPPPPRPVRYAGSGIVRYDCPLCRALGRPTTFERHQPDLYIVHLLAHTGSRDPLAEHLAEGED